MDDKFEFTYSAKEQEEIKKIREKYVAREEDKMSVLRRLDASASQKATTVALVLGVVGTLVMGFGMSCCMVWGNTLFIPGIIVGLLGILLVSGAYPVYNKMLKAERQRIAPEILRLTDELMK